MGGLDLPLLPSDTVVGADGATHGWFWVVHGILGLPSTITVTFTDGGQKSVASDVLEVVQVGGSGVDHDTAAPGLVTSNVITVSLASPGSGDSELAFLYVNGDSAGDPGWTTPGIATLSGSVIHSPSGTAGYGALVAYAAQALASATTRKSCPPATGTATSASRPTSYPELGGARRLATLTVPASARSSGDRALPCGGRGRKFDSCRAHGSPSHCWGQRGVEGLRFVSCSRPSARPLPTSRARHKLDARTHHELGSTHRDCGTQLTSPARSPDQLPHKLVTRPVAKD